MPAHSRLAMTVPTSATSSPASILSRKLDSVVPPPEIKTATLNVLKVESLIELDYLTAGRDTRDGLIRPD